MGIESSILMGALLAAVDVGFAQYFFPFISPLRLFSNIGVAIICAGGLLKVGGFSGKFDSHIAGVDKKMFERAFRVAEDAVNKCLPFLCGVVLWEDQKESTKVLVGFYLL